jgi:predicted molibdopterin-dependent oxidoreductase YjgC
MPDTVRLLINGRAMLVPEGTTVAVAMEMAGQMHARRSVTHQPRAALCGMGVCFECRVTIDGVAHCRGCQTRCVEGMEVTTDE